MRRSRGFVLGALCALGVLGVLAACGTEADVGDGDDAAAQAVVTVRCGDVNSSGTITVTDASMASSIAAGSLTPTAAQRWAADVDASGAVTSADAQQIARAAAGLSVTLRCSMFGPITK